MRAYEAIFDPKIRFVRTFLLPHSISSLHLPKTYRVYFG
jgi:hypothetical protein